MTLECIDSILMSNYKYYKIIVVDNGSIKEDYENLVNNIDDNRVLVDRIVDNCGYVYGVNRGLSIGGEHDADYYLIMNNDTIIDKNAIKSLVDAGERYDQNAIMSGKVYHYDNPDTLQYVGGKIKDKRYLKMTNPNINEKDIGQCEFEKERDMLDDIFWLLPNKILQNIGNYSNHFFLYAEQGDYARRALNAGYKLIYTPSAKIWHKGSLTTGNGDRFAPHVNYWRKKGSIIYRAKHLRKKYFWIYSVKLLFRFCIKSIIFKLIGKNEFSRINFAAFRGVFDGILWTFNKVENKGYNPYL